MTRASLGLLAMVVVACSNSAPPSPSTAAAGPDVSPGATRDPSSPYSTTREEFLLRTKACVEDRGFPVELDLRQGGFQFSLGNDERAKEAGVVLRDCMKSIDPARADPPPKLTSQQLDAWYGYKLREAACMREAGYAVPEAPPRQVFADTNGEWDPFGAMLDAGTVVPPDKVQRCEGVDGRPPFLDW